MRRQNAVPNVPKLDCDTTAFWLGHLPGKRLIIYFPGDGFCLPTVLGYFSHIEALCEDIRKHNKDIRALFLAYDIAPQPQWPRRLQQSVITLQYAIQTPGNLPSDSVLQGDSAGANLALVLSSHLIHPHPDDTVVRFVFDESISRPSHSWVEM